MSSPAAARHIQPWSLWLIAAFLLGGVLVSINYVKRNRAEALDPRPPYLGKLERDLEAQNRDGTTVHLASLKGKIWLASYLYTDSPAKAPAVARLLTRMWEEFGSDPRLQVVTFSANPGGDTPEKRKEFLRQHGVDDPRWWFLTADARDLSRLVSRYLQLMPAHPVSSPELAASWGPLEHDLRVVLIDGKANVRGRYQLLRSQHATLEMDRLRRDLRYLLERTENAPR